MDNFETFLQYLLTEQEADPKKISARQVVQFLLGNRPSTMTKRKLLNLKNLLNRSGWKDIQLPDLLKAIYLIDTEPKIAFGYLYRTSHQGHPIENKIPGGGGNGVLKDLQNFLRNS